VDAAASGVRCEAQGGLLSVSDLRHARRRRCLRTEKSCGPDASTLASSLAEARSAQPGCAKPSIRKATVAKEPIAEESAKETVKTTACGNAGRFRCDRCEYSCAFSITIPHTRLRVHRAPGIPHALYGRELMQRLGRIAPRERSRIRNNGSAIGCLTIEPSHVVPCESRDP
jgi:hypothetical protein